MTTTSDTQTFTAQAYELINKLVYPNSDFDYEAELIEFPGWRETDTGFWEPIAAKIGTIEGEVVREKKEDGRWQTVEFKLPEKIEFETVGDIIHQTDYPYCKPQLPIMSKWMLETLLSVGEFPHQLIPVTMIDIQKYYDELVGDYVAPEEKLDNFVAVQLLEHLDIFDWERSVYTFKPHLPHMLGQIDQLVLKEIEGGLPPLFRIKTRRTRLYVSPQGRAALEAANIQGVEFLNLVH